MNWFQGIDSASQCSLAGRYDNPFPTQFLAPIEYYKIPAQYVGRARDGVEGGGAVLPRADLKENQTGEQNRSSFTSIHTTEQYILTNLGFF